MENIEMENRIKIGVSLNTGKKNSPFLVNIDSFDIDFSMMSMMMTMILKKEKFNPRDKIRIRRN